MRFWQYYEIGFTKIHEETQRLAEVLEHRFHGFTQIVGNQNRKKNLNADLGGWRRFSRISFLCYLGTIEIDYLMALVPGNDYIDKLRQ